MAAQPRHGGTASRRLKAGLVALVAVLMMLNAIGAYGFLAKADIGLAGDLVVSGRAAAINYSHRQPFSVAPWPRYGRPPLRR